MARYRIYVQRPIWEYNDFEVEAASEAEAEAKAQQIIEDYNQGFAPDGDFDVRGFDNGWERNDLPDDVEYYDLGLEDPAHPHAARGFGNVGHPHE